MSIFIDWPVEGNAQSVVSDGMGGWIMCVKGHIDDAAFDTTTIQVIVLAGTQSPTPTPPTGSTPVSFSGSNWLASNVPVPQAPRANPPYPALTVIAWEPNLSGSGYQAPTAVYPCGMQATQVDCGSGALIPCGSGAGFMQLASAAGKAVGATAVALAPAVWTMALGGFSDLLGTAVSGFCLLELRDGVGAGGLWDNGGDGLSGPRVELRCDGPPQPLWRLRLRQASLTLEYSAPAAWEAVGPLTLTADLPAPFPRTLTLLPV